MNQQNSDPIELSPQDYKIEVIETSGEMATPIKDTHDSASSYNQVSEPLKADFFTQRASHLPGPLRMFLAFAAFFIIGTFILTILLGAFILNLILRVFAPTLAQKLKARTSFKGFVFRGPNFR
jgi:hypothetical protein